MFDIPPFNNSTNESAMQDNLHISILLLVSLGWCKNGVESADVDFPSKSGSRQPLKGKS